MRLIPLLAEFEKATWACSQAHNYPVEFEVMLGAAQLAHFLDPLPDKLASTHDGMPHSATEFFHFLTQIVKDNPFPRVVVAFASTILTRRKRVHTTGTLWWCGNYPLGRHIVYHTDPVV